MINVFIFNEKQIKITLSVMGILLLMSVISFAQELKINIPSELVISTNIKGDRISVSYNGFVAIDKRLDASSNDEGNKALPVSHASGTDLLVKNLEQVSRHVLRYVLMDNSERNVKSNTFKLESRIDTSRVKREYDISLALNIGCDDAGDPGINGVKMSSYMFNTYLDAVYYDKDKEVEFFFTNTSINHYLMDGMMLEFQVSPQKETGAVLFTMNF